MSKYPGTVASLGVLGLVLSVVLLGYQLNDTNRTARIAHNEALKTAQGNCELYQLMRDLPPNKMAANQKLRQEGARLFGFYQCDHTLSQSPQSTS